MKEFMFIYNGGDPDWMSDKSPEEIEASMAVWGEWMGKLQASDNLVTGGSPLHFEGKRMNSDHVVTDIAASEFKELVSGYSIVKAETVEQALEFAKDCPIFEHPEIEIEIREIMQMG